MKRFIVVLCVMFVTVLSVAAGPFQDPPEPSLDPVDYWPDNVYVCCGNHQYLYGGKTPSKYYLFKNQPVFMQEDEDLFLSLREEKFCPLTKFRYTLSIPIEVTFVKEDVFLLGEVYASESWKVSEEFSKYEKVIESMLKGYSFGEVRGGAPKFLSDHIKDNLPVKTQLRCTASLFFDASALPLQEPLPYMCEGFVKNKKGKEKKAVRRILVYCVNEPYLKFSDEGELKEIIEPEKEKIQTPFGVMDIPISSIRLPTDVPKYIRIGAAEPLFGPDYTYGQVTKIKTENELKALYQTRKGYELKSGLCAVVPGDSIVEKSSEFYIGSTHLVCSDEAWTAVHTEVVKKNYLYTLAIDLRYINGKVEFVIASVKN